MSGIFGAISKEDCSTDIYFGTDYHSHLGTKKGGMCMYGDGKFKRTIHDISDTPFRSKLGKDINSMSGTAGIGVISDSDSQPLTYYGKGGKFSVATVGRINNKSQLIEELTQAGAAHFSISNDGEVANTDLAAALIAEKNSIPEGIFNVQERIDGSMTMLVLTEDGVYAARDKWGRTPLILGKSDISWCAASESFAFINIGYEYQKELGAGEVVKLTADGPEQVKPPEEEMRICTFLWTYFGYTTSIYEGKNVELMRNENGRLIAEGDTDVDVDYVAGVPDSGTAHALGYANGSHIPYARPLIKYTPTWPRSFMPPNQKGRELIAKMKLVPVFQMIKNRKFILVDDSIVRGTQLSDTSQYLKDNGASEIHVRSACPPIMYGCKYLNFSRSVSEMELIARRAIKEIEGLETDEMSEELLNKYAATDTEEHAKMVEYIRDKLSLDSLKYQSLENLIKAVGIDECKLCTYCWNGKE